MALKNLLKASGLGFAVAAALSLPSTANAQWRGGGWNGGWHGGGVSTGAAVGIGLGSFALGTAGGSAPPPPFRYFRDGAPPGFFPPPPGYPLPARLVPPVGGFFALL